MGDYLMAETSTRRAATLKRLFCGWPLAIGLAFACLGALAWQLYGVRWASSDSWAPMNVALQVLRGPDADQLYQTVFFAKGIKFQYPPSSLFYIEFFDVLGLNTYGRLNAINWVLFAANATLVGLLAVQLLVRPEVERYRRAIFLGSFFCALVYGPIAIGLHIGQIQILINLLFTLSCLALVHQRSLLAGALMGAATAVKPQFGILLVLAALCRHWRFVLGFCVVATCLGLLSIAVYGWGNHLEYFKVLRYLSERGEVFVWNNSVNGILNRLRGNGSSGEIVLVSGVYQSLVPAYDPFVFWSSLVTAVILLSLPVALPFVVPSAKADGIGSLLIYGTGATCSVIASPIAWIHHYGILLPVYLICLRFILDQGGRHRNTALVVLAVSFCLTALQHVPFRSATGPLSILNATTFFGAALLLVLIVVLLIRHERRTEVDAL
jgi:alpha-1,2-mannosyltransferase